MPIYEYACQHCGYQLEARQKFSDPPLHQCPACEQDGLERLISESSFALKGSGWYADGYGGAGKEKDKAKNGATVSSGEGATKAEPKPEAKPEKKAEPKPAAKAD